MKIVKYKIFTPKNNAAFNEKYVLFFDDRRRKFPRYCFGMKEKFRRKLFIARPKTTEICK